MTQNTFKPFKKGDDTYCAVNITNLNQGVNVIIYDFEEGDELSDFAKQSLLDINQLSQIEINKMIDQFWIFAKNCMECSNYGPDIDDIKEGETQLEHSMKNLNIFNKNQAFERTKVKYADTSNNGYGGFVNGINSASKLWFETPWDDHFTVVIIENGEICDYEHA